MNHFRSWKEMKIGLRKRLTIDEHLQKNLRAEVLHWRETLSRLIKCVQFLGSQSLAFRGGSDVLYAENNGNFLKLVEMIATFDPVLKHHLNKIKCAETRTHYLSKTIQKLISDAVRVNIINMIKEVKYFSIIVDCTPDKSHVEQTTIIVRFVGFEESSSDYVVKENVLVFLPTTDTTGKGLTDLVLREINKLGLSIHNCRGQGYDNGSNMKGKFSGVQRRIREIEPRAFFVPCGSHSLNFVVNDSANCSKDSVAFFEHVQSLYNFFCEFDCTLGNTESQHQRVDS